MQTSMPTKPPAIARTLHFLLVIVIAILIVGILALLAFAVMVMLPTGFRETAMEQIRQSGVSAPSVTALVIGPLGGAVMAAAYLYVATVVRAIVKTTFNGNPFVPENISRLRKTWVVIALAEIFRVIMTGFSLRPASTEGGYLENFSIDTHLSAWFLVFVIAIMAEVFRLGLELQRDQELTV